jgi:hypothetical protein
LERSMFAFLNSSSNISSMLAADFMPS